MAYKKFQSPFILLRKPFYLHVVLSSNHLCCWIYRFWMTYLHQRYSNCVGTLTHCKRKIWSRRQKLWKCGPCSIVILLNTRTTTINSIFFFCKYKIDERVFTFNFIPLESKWKVGMGTTNHWWYRYIDNTVSYRQVFGNFELVLSIFCRLTTISSIIYFHFLCSFLSFWNM